MSYQASPKILPGTHVADADLSAKQFYAAKISSTGVALAGAGEAAFILQNKPVLGAQCELATDGISKGIAGAAFARGVLLASDANGKLITATAGSYIIGQALEATGGADEIVAVKVLQSRLEV